MTPGSRSSSRTSSPTSSSTRPSHNPYHFPPRWLNEGLAVYESEGYDTSDRASVRDAAGTSGLLPLTGLEASSRRAAGLPPGLR